MDTMGPMQPVLSLQDSTISISMSGHPKAQPQPNSRMSQTLETDLFSRFGFGRREAEVAARLSALVLSASPFLGESILDTRKQESVKTEEGAQ